MKIQILFILSFIFLSGCNPLGSTNQMSSTIDPGFRPGVSTGPVEDHSLSAVWNFNLANASQLELSDPELIQLTTNSCELKMRRGIAADDQTNLFAGAELSGLVWDNSGKKLHLQPTVQNDSEMSTTNWTPKKDQLTGLWHLNEASGNVADSSGYDNHGMTYSLQHDQPAKLGKGLFFPGSINPTSYINLPSVSSAAISVSVWVNPSDVNGMIFSRRRGCVTEGFSFSGATVVTAGGSFGYPPLEVNKWTLLTVTYDGSTLKVYKNGLEAYSTGLGFYLPPNIPTRIGVREVYGECDIVVPFTGYIDEIAIWGTALSPEDVRLIYERQQIAYSGSVISRIFDGNIVGRDWEQFGWKTSLPFGKDIPSSNESVSSYSNLTSHLSSGLVGLWHMNEVAGSTSVPDSSGHGNHATASNVVFVNDFRHGQVATFDKNPNTNVEIPDSASLQFTDSMSVSLWMKKNGNGTPWDVLISKGVWDDASGWYFYDQQLSGSLCYLNAQEESTRICTPSGSIPRNEWVHISLVNNAGFSTIYVNSVAVASGFSVAVKNSNSPLVIGSRTNNNGIGYADGFPGSLDEVGVWSRGLSVGEVQELYRRGVNRVKFQVRTCANADCSDDNASPSWKGPDGSAFSYFSEKNNSATFDISASLSQGATSASSAILRFDKFKAPRPAHKQYFQYRAVLESDDASLSPDLKEVFAGPGLYPTTAPHVLTKNGISYKSLSEMIETLDTDGCSSGVSYNLGLNSAGTVRWYFLSGGVWTEADGSANEATVASALNSTSLTSFVTQFGAGSVYLKAFLGSSGTSQCQLKSFKVIGLK